jgi:hypothetical protein
MPYRLPPNLNEVARLQSAVLSSAQLVRGGLSRQSLSSLVRLGHWQRLHRGVYATFSGEPPREAWLWAAVLAAGPGAMLSHQSAAEVAGLTDEASDLTHVTVPAARRVRRIAGVVIHYSARAADAVHPARVPPQTRIEETVLDLADQARSPDNAIAWVTQILGRRLTTQVKLRQALELRTRTRWRAELNELLNPDAEGLHSILEYRYHYDVERPHGLPAGSRQARFQYNGRNAYRDRFYEEYLTVVELDGRATHTIDRRWDDIHRDNATSAEGVLTMRYGWRDVTEHPCQVAAEVARALANRGFTGARPCSPSCPVGRATGRTAGL